MARLLAVCVLVVLCTLSASATWIPDGTRNVAAASMFVDGPTVAEWYDQDEPDVVKLRTSRYCGDIGYAIVVHFSCDTSDDKHQSNNLLPVPSEVGSCVFGSTIDWYEIVPGVGADAFTATCYLQNTDACGHEECSGVQLNVIGTAFIFSNAYALTNPTPGSLYDPNCDYLPRLGGKRSAGDRNSTKQSKRHHHLRQDTEDKPAAPSEARVMYNRETHQAPAALPATVWAGWSYLYSGYMTVWKDKRTVGEGSFEMAWPFNYAGWNQVDSSTLPADALFVKNPYIATLEIFDKRKEYAHRSN